MVDFSELTSKKVGEIKRPPTKPAGTYLATIARYDFGNSSKKGTPLCKFTFVNVQPGEDIDLEALKDEDGTPVDLSKFKPTYDFYMTDDALFMLSEFLEDMVPNAQGRSINELLPETRGMPVVLTVSMKPSDDGTRFFNRVEKVTAQK